MNPRIQNGSQAQKLIDKQVLLAGSQMSLFFSDADKIRSVLWHACWGYETDQCSFILPQDNLGKKTPCV